MEFPHPFDNDQSSYLARVLRELELKTDTLFNKVSSVNNGANLTNNGATVTADAITIIPNNCDYFILTGTTVVNAFSAKPIGYTLRIALSVGVVLTHSSLSLQLNGGENRTAYGNDIIELVCIGTDVLGNGVWRETAYTYEKAAPTFEAAPLNTSISNVTPTKINMSEISDPQNCFSGNAFTPNVPGYYQINSCIQSAASGAVFFSQFFINGVARNLSQYTGLGENGGVSCISALVFLNGTTDTVDVRAVSSINGSGIVSGSFAHRFTGFLAKRA